MAPLSGPSARHRCAARVGPLASSGNAAIGTESKPDTTDSLITGHWLQAVDDMSLDSITFAAEKPDRFAALIHHLDIVDAGTLGEAPLLRITGQDIALACRRQTCGRPT